MFRFGTGYRLWPLKSSGIDNVTLVQGSPTFFDMSDVPTTTGNQANYLPLLIGSISGAIAQGGAGTQINWDNFKRTLCQSVELRNAWHGTPLQAAHCLGAFWNTIEYVGCGYRYAARHRAQIPSAAGTYNFKWTFAIPLCAGVGSNPLQTAQLALLYKQAQLVFTTAPLSVLTSITTGASFGALTMRLSAALAPRDEIMLAPGIEWIDYQSVAQAGQTQIPLKTFGNSTGLNGVEPDAGVLFMGAMTAAVPNGGNGSFTADTVTRYSFQWLGQYETQHPDALAVQQLMSMGPQRIVETTQQQSVPPTTQDAAGFPYVDGNDFTTTAPGEMSGLLFFPIVTPSEDLKLGKLPVAFGEQSYLMAATFSNNHHNLVQQAKSWTADKKSDFLSQIIKSGLAAQVLGAKGWKGEALRLVVKTLDEPKEQIAGTKKRFLPRQVQWGNGPAT